MAHAWLVLQAYQEPVLDALAAWLDSDTSRVEARLLEQSATDRLVLLLPTIATAGGSLLGWCGWGAAGRVGSRSNGGKPAWVVCLCKDN